MTEWLREGIEGRSLRATLRLYLLGLILLAPAAAVLALAFGGQASFVATPLLVLVVVGIEYAISYRARLRKYVGEPIRTRRLLVENKWLISLVRVLSPDSVNFRKQASIDLPKEEKSFESLVHEVLYGRNYAVRAWAILALREKGDWRSVDRLISALQDGNPKVRYLAVMALKHLGDIRAVEPLVNALGDEVALVRSTAAVALSEISSSLPAAQAITAREVIETWRRRVSKDGSDGKPLNDKDVSTPDEPVRKRA